MKLLIPILLIAFFIPIHPVPAYADVAPPEQPPGSSLMPGEGGTQVRMLAETVLLEVTSDKPDGSLGKALVTASFIMRNLGAQSE